MSLSEIAVRVAMGKLPKEALILALALKAEAK